MRAYLLSTGALFGGVTIVHVWRLVQEPHLATHAWYIMLTTGTAALAVWAWRLFRRPVHS
jgi:hypothetical protein